MFTGLDGRRHDYCCDTYNASWSNERAVEIPIALDWVARQTGRGMEVGNVLGHYTRRTWPVVDRYERAPGVFNADICATRPRHQLDWIVSISTVEHIGWDDQPRDPWKAFVAISRMRSLLAPDGQLLLSYPSGHHPGLDYMTDRWPATSSVFLARVDRPNDRRPGIWRPAPPSPVPYLHHAWSAGAVWVGVLPAV